jgi:hypothetical protein
LEIKIKTFFGGIEFELREASLKKTTPLVQFLFFFWGCRPHELLGQAGLQP